MALIRPRLLDHFGIPVSQEQTSFAIPFLDEDIPLYLDPFLLWKSPSQHENALHNLVVSAFDHVGHAALAGKRDEAIQFLIQCSECDEVGLGVSAKQTGRRIGPKAAAAILDTITNLPRFVSHGRAGPGNLHRTISGVSA